MTWKCTHDGFPISWKVTFKALPQATWDAEEIEFKIAHHLSSQDDFYAVLISLKIK